MGGLILTGMGIAIGFALWPIALPALVVVALVGAAGHLTPKETPKRQRRPAGAPRPLLEMERTQALAAIEAINREHLERCLEDPDKHS